MPYAVLDHLRVAAPATALVVLAAALSPAQAAECSVSIEDMSLGSIDTLSGFSGQTSAGISMSCDQVAVDIPVVTVCANLGAGSGGANAGVRRLRYGSNTLAYGLYADPGSGLPWGASDAPALGQPQTFRLPVSGGSASGSAVIYAEAFAGQTEAGAGTYASTVDATFIYADGDSLNCAAPSGGTVVGRSFSVEATVAANCLIEADPLDFGRHGVIDSEVTASSELRVTCTPDTRYDISMDGGRQGATDPERRLMQSGANTIAYGLYSDSRHAKPWGVSADALVSGTGAGGVETYPVYGRVAPQSAAAGSYTDTVVVTITYN